MKYESNEKIQSKRNESMKLLDPMKKHHINCVAINTGNTKEHELKKFDAAFELIKSGYHVVTEAYWKNGKGRADIFVLDTRRVIEILHTETEEKARKKTQKYPISQEDTTFIQT